MSLEEIKKKSEYSFKRLVKIKAEEFTLNYLLELKERHSKMEKSEYIEMKLQNYLKDEKIPVDEGKNLYRYRTRSAKYKENMKTSYQATPCPFCSVQPDTQLHSVQCTVVKSKVKIEGNYDDIFQEDIPRDISQTLFRISQLREDVI